MRFLRRRRRNRRRRYVCTPRRRWRENESATSKTIHFFAVCQDIIACNSFFFFLLLLPRLLYSIYIVNCYQDFTPKLGNFLLSLSPLLFSFALYNHFSLVTTVIFVSAFFFLFLFFSFPFGRFLSSLCCMLSQSTKFNTARTITSPPPPANVPRCPHKKNRNTSEVPGRGGATRGG